MAQKKQLNENDVVHIGTDNKSEDKTRYRKDRILHMLPFDQRSVIILRYYHKKTISFIARIMECDEDEVRSKLYQAAEILKPVLSS